jgi:D-aspartate ligase
MTPGERGTTRVALSDAPSTETANGRQTQGPNGHPAAYVLGGIDVVQALGLAGIRSTVFARPGGLSRYSRFTNRAIDTADAWKRPEDLVERLIGIARDEPDRPVLYYSGDWELLAVSRFRDRLEQFFRYVVADPTLIDTLVDKARFQVFAEELGLPVPRAQCLFPDRGSTPADIDLEFPVVVKPLIRQHQVWRPLARAKALRVEVPQQLRELWPKFADANLEILVQELVPGPESEIESYHVYISDDGRIRGEFAGRKIRTYPNEFGYSTALVTTADEAVLELGRDLSRRVGLKGVAKYDFKRAPDGRLYLLEINPRFNLWHHLGAKAGVNIPELVYRDLAGKLPARMPAPARAGARWCSPRHDVQAARAEGIPFFRWLAWAMTCDAKSGFSRQDPMPIIRGGLWRFSESMKSKVRTGRGKATFWRRPPSSTANDEPNDA